MDANSTPIGSYDFLMGGGSMGELIRSKDWANTPLGPVDGWSRSLKTVVFLMLNSRYPMFVWWGRELINFYNDAYIPVLGARHPDALGQPAASVWGEIWNVVGPQAEAVLRAGRATWNESLLLLMERYGFVEETYFTFSYSPALDDDGNVGGVFCACTEDTKRIIGERRLRTVRRLAEQATHAKSVGEACDIAVATMRDNPYDLPFALIYLLDAAGAQARLAGGTLPDTPASPAVIDLSDAVDGAWPLAQVRACGESQVVSDLDAKFGPGVKLPGGAWPEPARQAVVLPLARPGQTAAPYGFLIAGINPRLLLDDDYRVFLQLTAGHIANAAADARAHEEERKRVEALAQIDRAKTAFFSNVSHEFRTPLTLILGPAEELLSGVLGSTNEIQREHLLTLRHNAVRLQKLVNALLDFARVEAGRIEAIYEPVDIGVLTRDIAATFCSAVHRAGLLYVVNCPSIEEPVYVDRDMWEKIVLNLLSNALKFTFKGAIEVSVESSGDRVAFVVRDTGVGIPDEELPHLFDRFHRVYGSRARTQEGSGIGLALVQELVKLHGGSLQVESALDAGTTFTILVPKGSAHLPKERLSAPRSLSLTALGAAPFVEEALRWLPNSDEVETPLLPVSSSTLTPVPRPSGGSERILIADDNLEMRNYLKRLLEPHWNVTVVEDGAKALESARAQQPDLILSDVMIPGLDGFALLRALRDDNQTRAIPVILLSARAGEESYIEGMNAGADDYIVKPFGARELVARVKALLEVTRVRRDSERRVTQILESITDGFQVIASDWRLTYMNSEAKRTLAEHGLDPEWAIGKHFLEEVFPEAVENKIATELRRAMAERVPVTVEFYYPPWKRWYFNRVYPLPEGGLANYFQDITERKEAEMAKGRLGAIVESAEDAIISKDLNGVIASWNFGAERLFGYTAREAIGQPVNMLIPADRFDEEPSILKRIRRGERIQNYETVRRRKDGRLLDISLSISPIVDAHGQIVGASKIARDITGRKLAERKLRESEERFRTMADSSPIMIWTTDATGSLTFANRAYMEFFGGGSENLPTSDWRQRIHSEDRDRYLEGFNAALREPHPFYERVRVLRWDGRLRWLEARGRPLFDDVTRVTGYIGSSLDITDIYESQQRLKELDQRKDEFLANMSHEIRSPLTGIMGFADILLSRLKDPEDIECLNVIKESGDYLIEIVNDILDLSKIEAGKLVLNIEAVSVHSILGEVQALMDVRARQKKLPLVLRYESALPESVHTDRTRLRQILINLVSNAIKFTESGRVEIVARFIDSLLQIEVIDTGIGIAPDHQEALFQPFTQADPTSTRQYGGTGLGLSITRRLVEMLGGSISFESELGKGSTFRVRIPAGTTRNMSKATHLEPRAGASFDEVWLRNRRVLVVDDRQEFRHLLSKYIKDAGGRPDAAADGKAAIKAIEAAAVTDPYDAMILDIHMPGMDGYEVARTVRAKGFQMAIIALTAGAMAGDREKCLRAGCDDYLTKPIDRRKLARLVDQHAKKAGRGIKTNGVKLRMLLVDDSHNACKFLSAFLEKRGHEVRSAYDGASALSLAEEFRPDLILLDIRLPDMSGYDLMERLKALGSFNGAKFIALSGYRDIDAPGPVKFDHFLEKPLDTVQLETLLQSFAN